MHIQRDWTAVALMWLSKLSHNLPVFFSLLSHHKVYDHGAGIWASVKVSPFQLASSRVNIISSSDVLWSAALPGRLLFWVGLSAFTLFGLQSHQDINFLLCTAWAASYCMCFPSMIMSSTACIWQTMNILNALFFVWNILPPAWPSKNIYFLCFSWSPWLRCFFSAGSHLLKILFIKACTLCVEISLGTEAMLLISLVQRAGRNLYFQMLRDSEETFFTLYNHDVLLARYVLAPFHLYGDKLVLLMCSYELYLPSSASACFFFDHPIMEKMSGCKYVC